MFVWGKDRARAKSEAEAQRFINLNPSFAKIYRHIREDILGRKENDEELFSKEAVSGLNSEYVIAFDRLRTSKNLNHELDAWVAYFTDYLQKTANHEYENKTKLVWLGQYTMSSVIGRIIFAVAPGLAICAQLPHDAVEELSKVMIQRLHVVFQSASPNTVAYGILQAGSRVLDEVKQLNRR